MKYCHQEIKHCQELVPKAGNNPKVGSVCLVLSPPQAQVISPSPTTKVMFFPNLLTPTLGNPGAESSLPICRMPELTFYSHPSVPKADSSLVFKAHLEPNKLQKQSRGCSSPAQNWWMCYHRNGGTNLPDRFDPLGTS